MAADTALCQRFSIHGRVQGVWYRASTQAQAERLGLRGFARNRDDGSVEVVACGAPDALAALARWLEEGPTDARVTAVHAEPADDPGLEGFVVR